MQFVKENLTPELDAGDYQCVIAKNGTNCSGQDCMAWRWFPLQANTPEYIAALKECEFERGMKPKDAAAYVNKNRAEFGIPEEPFEGYCGLAGQP